MDAAVTLVRRWNRATRIVLFGVALLGGIGGLSACSAGGNGASGAACTEAASCPGVRILECTPMIECQAQCLIDNHCSGDAVFAACVRESCADLVADTGPGWDSGTYTPDTKLPSSEEPGDTGSGGGGGTDTGSGGGGGTDTGGGGGGGGGGWGCSKDSANSCTCAAGVTDDGAGCSKSTIALPGVCCSTSSRCRCESIQCTSNSGGCACMVVGGPSTSTSCSGKLCCAFSASSSAGVGYCACYDKPGTGGCAALGGTTVSSCGASNVPCYYKDESSVARCK